MNRDGAPRLAVIVDAPDAFNDQILEIRIDLTWPSGSRAGTKGTNTAFIPAMDPVAQGRRLDRKQVADVTDTFPEQAVTNRL
ncbi:hypothetical protein BMS3Bbin04_02082 [bacterium BMS3Bbin04]|nr:hypothetical protein BMS3Bbin04_02082 [bacterium BMS3Bbin04]